MVRAASKHVVRDLTCRGKSLATTVATPENCYRRIDYKLHVPGDTDIHSLGTVELLDYIIVDCSAGLVTDTLGRSKIRYTVYKIYNQSLKVTNISFYKTKLKI